LSVGELTVNGERRFTGILHDLSARIQMEDQLREQNALARLGEMAAVIAHEVKNPLAGVRGAIQVIGSRLPADSRDAVVVKEILTRIDGLNELMKDLLLFARPPQPHPMAVDLGALIQTIADLLSGDPALRSIAIDVAGSPQLVMADAGLLKIVIQNLLINAAQAMHGQGTIRISFDAADGMCRVAIRDTGPGIPADVLQKIFTPFFTTKARGTGLGLPTAKRILEAHGGSIAVRSAPGGTNVEFELPLAAP
jgi:signal transduction histidine kinase